MLDEATSALDSITEGRVMEAIYSNFPDVTLIMIAHRISTVEHCDQLLVFDRGKLVASGSHQELLQSNELFRGLATFST